MHIESHHFFQFKEEFWVAVAFVLLVALTYRPLKRLFSQALATRAARICTELFEAKRLREDALLLLKEYKEKQGSFDA